MAKLRVPKKYQSGVAAIRDLSEPQAREIRNALDKLFALKSPDQTISSGKEISELATSALTTTGTNQQTASIRAIGEALAALYSVRSSYDEPLEQFIESVSDAMESLEDSARLSETDRERFKTNLGILLDAAAFGIASKIVDLKTEDERVFCNARIVTDLRPVFGARVEDGPQGMIVMHLLKLSYHCGSPEHKEFHIALDSGDLETLKSLIDRAEAKTRSLKSNLKSVRLFGAGRE